MIYDCLVYLLTFFHPHLNISEACALCRLFVLCHRTAGHNLTEAWVIMHFKVVFSPFKNRPKTGWKKRGKRDRPWSWIYERLLPNQVIDILDLHRYFFSPDSPSDDRKFLLFCRSLKIVCLDARRTFFCSFRIFDFACRSFARSRKCRDINSI